jgi:hypothetical protein
MAMLPWLDDETEDVGLPSMAPQAPDDFVAPKPQIDPAVRQSIIDKYKIASSDQGVKDAQDTAKYQKAAGAVADNLGGILGNPTAVVYKNGWGDASVPKSQLVGGLDTKGSGDAFRDSAKTGVAQAQQDRANKIQGFEEENKLNNQVREQGRQDNTDAFTAEQQDQTRNGWDATNRANDPKSAAADQGRLLLQSTLVQKAKAAREAGDSDAAAQLMDQAKSAGQGMSATEIMGLHNQIKDLSYDDILKTKNQKANLEATQAYRTTLNDQHRDKESRTAATKLAGDLQANRGDKGAQMASANVLQADNALKLIAQYPDLDKMPKEQVAQLNSEIAKIATGGVASEHATGEMSSDNLQGRAAKWQSFFSSNPTPAQQGAFIRANMSYLKDLRENSASYLKNRRKTLIQGNKSISEDDRADLYKQYNIDPSDDGSSPSSPVAQAPSAPGRTVVGSFNDLK